MLTILEKLNHQGFKYLCCGQGGLSCLFSHMEKSVTRMPQMYNVRMCVFMFLFVCMWWSLCSSKHLIQRFCSVFLLLSSTSVSCHLILPFTTFSPGGDYEWHDTIVPTLCSVTHRQEKSVSVGARKPISPFCHFHSHRLSQQVGSGGFTLWHHSSLLVSWQVRHQHHRLD